MGQRSEVRLPADRRFIVVAKRAVAGFASVAGLHLEALDDLVIAVSQACENAILVTERAAGAGNGQIRIVFNLSESGLEVHVRSTCTRAELEAGREAALAAAAAPKHPRHAEHHELALKVMGLFVDEFRYRVDENNGGLRVRLTKYRSSS
jgi:anti-sigma regulatory factor (Ser/Thr protein kinase)